MHRSLLVAAISLFLVACHHHSASDGKSGYGNATFSPGITEADVSQHVKVLASDAFEGRAPGSKGEQRTTEYLIQQFQRMGLQPGNQGSWLQAVPYVQATLQHADQVQLAIDGGKGKSELGFGSDMVVGSPAGEPHAAITDSPIVNIYHGAVDNASGVAGLLEIAEAFAHRRPKPPRTILFMALTMEESGLLGSRYYVNHPVLPLDLTLADL
ncbi:MAG: M20/M25/M40 family metallo-hydrolase, partial [Rhodanobacter sp.]